MSLSKTLDTIIEIEATRFEKFINTAYALNEYKKYTAYDYMLARKAQAYPQHYKKGYHVNV